MKKFLFLLFLLSSYAAAVFAQAQKEYNIWYFGNQAGLDFNSGSPVPLTDGMLITDEGCASIADSSGNLLFYTDGITIFNKNHQVMTNGSGLMGDPTSSQSAIIVPQPGSSFYYIFTVDKHGEPNGLRYSIVEINSQNGLGQVIIKNILLTTPVAEKVTAVKHANNIDYWIVSHKFNSADFVVYSLTGSGLNTTPITTTIGSVYEGVMFNAQGYLKVSPNGTKLASATDMAGYFEIFDFNNNTGVISNPVKITMQRPYGVEFSPDSRLLYISSWTQPCIINQFDLQQPTAADIEASAYTVWHGGPNYFTSAMQLGPDGRIYVATQGANSLHVINNPEVIGPGCNFAQHAVPLSNGKSTIGLPNFVQSGFIQLVMTYQNSCFGNATSFQIRNFSGDSVRWNFGDPASGAANTSTLENPTHTFTAPGTYRVTLLTYKNGTVTTNELLVHIDRFSVNLGKNTGICPGQELTLDATMPNATYLWQDNSTEATFTVTSPGIYSVKISLPCGTITDTITVGEECESLLIIPNIITPNHDGINDKLVPSTSYGITKMHTTIFNRWGTMVYKTDNLNIEWDGMAVSDGVYYWYIIYEDIHNNRHALKGWVEVVR